MAINKVATDVYKTFNCLINGLHGFSLLTVKQLKCNLLSVSGFKCFPDFLSQSFALHTAA